MSPLSLVGVPALTLHNPWAHAIAHCGKDVENRGWMPPRSLRRFMVHAGKAWDPSGVAFLREHGHQACAYDSAMSAVVAVADIAYVCDHSRHGGACDCGPWAMRGQIHWKLTGVVALPVPVECKGAQKLWQPTRAVAEAVARQLTEVPA